LAENFYNAGWAQKTRMTGLWGREKSLMISLAVSNRYDTRTWQTDGRTDTGRRLVPRLRVASRGEKRRAYTNCSLVRRACNGVACGSACDWEHTRDDLIRFWSERTAVTQCLAALRDVRKVFCTFWAATFCCRMLFLSFVFHFILPGAYIQWCGPRPSVLGQDRSETKKIGLGLGLGLADLVLLNAVLSRSSP